MSQGGSNPDGNTQASRFINEFPVFTNQIDLLIAKYEKLVDTEATQLDEINSLKVMVVDKDEKIRIHEQQCRELQKEVNELRANLKKTKKEHDVKVTELEKKLKAKEEEVGKMINKVEEMANSMTWEKLRSLNLGSGPQLDDSPNTRRSRSPSKVKRCSKSSSKKSEDDYKIEEKYIYKRRSPSCSRSPRKSEDDYRNELRKTMWPGKRPKSRSRDRGSSR